jgi:hypothetical protein
MIRLTRARPEFPAQTSVGRLVICLLGTSSSRQGVIVQSIFLGNRLIALDGWDGMAQHSKGHITYASNE